MKNQIKEIIKNTHKMINVQLDYKTFITMWDLSSLKKWLVRYPEAKVITN